MTKVDQQEKHSHYENGTVNLNPETKMFNNRFKFDAAADLAKSILEADTKAKMEALKGDQEKLDLISKAYPDYNYDKRKKAWYHKYTNEKLDPTKVQAATTTGK